MLEDMRSLMFICNLSRIYNCRGVEQTSHGSGSVCTLNCAAFTIKTEDGSEKALRNLVVS